MFESWHRARDGTLTRPDFQLQMKPSRQSVEALVLRGAFSGNDLFVGMCEELWRGRENLWAFINVEDVTPTNNAAERALRHAVIWRKLSFGTRSDSGSRFVETMLTVVEICRQRNCNALDYIIRAVEARQSAPNLLPGV